jgi:general bacterial porin, GBP family
MKCIYRLTSLSIMQRLSTQAVMILPLMVSLGLLASPASAEGSVTLYGRLDVGFAYQRINVPDSPIPDDGLDGVSTSELGMRSGQETGSRWGIKGSEDLGGGNSVNFVYEVGVTPSTGFTGSRARVSTLGFRSETWGRIDLGRRLSASSYALDDVDPMDGSYDTASLQSSMGSYSLRYSNQIWYRTPEFNGFTAAASYSFDVQKDIFYLVGNRPREVEMPDDLAPGQSEFSTKNKNRALSLGLRYDKGPLLLGASYDQIYPNSGTIATIPKQSPKAWIFGGSYDLKVVKIAAAVGQQFDGLIQGGQALSRAGINGGITNTQGDILLFPGAKVNSWMLGATVPAAGGSLFGSVQQARPAGTIVARGATKFQTIASVGYNYSFSKRTSVYAYYSYADDYLFVDGTVQTLGAGVVHKF